MELSTVIEKSIPAAGYCRLVLEAPYIAGRARPGQFALFYLPGEHRYHLPRPFSFFKTDPDRGRFSVFFQIKGLGTDLLAKAEPGEKWKLLGPLGSGFPPLNTGALLVAGGIGIAPLAFLAASSAVPRTLVYGARTAVDLSCPAEELDLPGLTVVETTDDGSRGRKGTATEQMAAFLPACSAVFACGPRPMLAAVAASCREASVEVWLSLEEQMACGIGACVCCAVETSFGFKRVCHDGPVFSAGEVFFR